MMEYIRRRCRYLKSRQEYNAVRNTVLALVIVAVASPVLGLAVLGQAALAQPNVNVMGEGVKLKTQEEVDAEKAREKNFKDGLGKIPDANRRKDPWGNVRSGSTAAQTKPNPK
jgi:hypothetical protein